jgi:glycosyltransferase involved in cell wall biosynthesis
MVEPLSAVAQAPVADIPKTAELELTIVMPCLNEAETLERCLVKAKDFLARHNVAGEVVVGDNGSTDGSQDIARRNGARVVDVPLRGYGAALYFATKSARGRYVIMGDSDDSYDFSDLMPFLTKLREGHDLVMGNRFLGGIKPGAMPFKNRYLGNPVLSGIGKLFFRSPANDFHCGIRGFSREAFTRLDLRTTGMEYASEMVIKATLLGLRIIEVPTTLSPDGRSRPPHLRPWRDGWRHLRFMLLYSPRWLFLYPGMLLMLAGLGVGAWLMPGPQVLGKATFDVHTLLFAAMAVLVGFQGVAFAIFTKVFGIAEGLLPQDPRLDRLFKYVTLETGLIAGVLILLLGLGGSLYAVGEWGARSFGVLEPQRMLRLVIPSATAVTLGFEVVLASFFLSVLGLRVRRLET